MEKLVDVDIVKVIHCLHVSKHYDTCCSDGR